MLVRLTRKQRIGAGWFVALTYLLCILAPTLSYAIPGDHPASHCLPLAVTSMQQMEDGSEQTMHAHLGGQIHDHAAMSMSDGDQMAAMSGDTDGDEVPASKGPHTKIGQCCALMCVSMMPAPLYEAAAPDVPVIVRLTTTYRGLTDRAPGVHYRPPIA